jgi:hypothetical protein
LSSPPPSSSPADATPASRPRGRLREWLLYHLADRRKRRSLVYAAVSLLLIGIVAAIKGAIGYYVFASAKESLYLALAVVAVVAGVFALFERRIDRALTPFGRTAAHRQALSDLAEGFPWSRIAELQRGLVTTLDTLLETRGRPSICGPTTSTSANNRRLGARDRDDDPPWFKCAAPATHRSHHRRRVGDRHPWSANAHRGQLVGFCRWCDHISFGGGLRRFGALKLRPLNDHFAARALDARPHHNLPQQLTRFVGHKC